MDFRYPLPVSIEARIVTVSSRYLVQGMTCEHCKLAVTEEVAGVHGVESVDIDLATGRVTVTGADVAEAAIRAAVGRAGYRVAS